MANILVVQFTMRTVLTGDPFEDADKIFQHKKYAEGVEAYLRDNPQPFADGYVMTRQIAEEAETPRDAAPTSSDEAQQPRRRRRTKEEMAAARAAEAATPPGGEQLDIEDAIEKVKASAANDAAESAEEPPASAPPWEQAANAPRIPIYKADGEVFSTFRTIPGAAERLIALIRDAQNQADLDRLFELNDEVVGNWPQPVRTSIYNAGQDMEARFNNAVSAA